MSERITEAELQAAIERNESDPLFDSGPALDAQRDVRTLVAEVRRLRALILEAEPLLDCGCFMEHKDGCPAARTEAEAEAIRAERGRE